MEADDAERSMGDDEKRPAVLPELREEARAFVAEIDAMLDRSEATPDLLRFTITVPREQALMAAWLMFKEDLRRDGQPRVLPRPVMLHLEDGRQARDWQRAKAYFQRTIFEQFDSDYTRLMTGLHPALHPSPAKPPEILVPQDVPMEDDLPF